VVGAPLRLSSGTLPARRTSCSAQLGSGSSRGELYADREMCSEEEGSSFLFQVIIKQDASQQETPFRLATHC